MLTHIQKSGQSLLDLLFPPRCVGCQAADGWLCHNCLSQIVLISSPVCERCGTPVAPGALICKQCQHNPLQYIDGIRSACYFEDNPIRSAIHLLKYRNHKAVVSILATLLAEAYRRFHLTVDVLMPVPLHPSRLRERGYNQSELLAKATSCLLGLPLDARSLRRIRHTKSQMTLGFDERHQNVTEAFACDNFAGVGQTILLVDDVCTTGSTLDACADALKKRGVAAVWGLTLAKAR